MNKINIEIMDNDIKVTINNKYIGWASLRALCDYSTSTPAFIGSMFEPIVEAMNEAREQMVWPKFLNEFYYPDTSSSSMYGSGIWHGYTPEEEMEKRGLVFKTKEEAIDVAKKMLGMVK